MPQIRFYGGPKDRQVWWAPDSRPVWVFPADHVTLYNFHNLSAGDLPPAKIPIVRYVRWRKWSDGVADFVLDTDPCLNTK